MALIFPVFILERLTLDTPTRSESSFFNKLFTIYLALYY